MKKLQKLLLGLHYIKVKDAFNNSKYVLMSEYFFFLISKNWCQITLFLLFLEIEANVKNFPRVSFPLNTWFGYDSTSVY